MNETHPEFEKRVREILKSEPFGTGPTKEDGSYYLIEVTHRIDLDFTKPRESMRQEILTTLEHYLAPSVATQIADKVLRDFTKAESATVGVVNRFRWTAHGEERYAKRPQDTE